MAYVPVPNTAQVNVRGMLDGQTVENTLYFTRSAGWDGQTLTDLAAAVASWWQVRMLPYLHQAYSLVEVVAVDLATQSGPSVTFAPNPPPAGQAAGDVLPNNVALCVSFRTGQRGRSYRGRNYIAAIPEGAITGNTFAQSFVTQIVDAYGFLPGAVAGLNADWVVVSRFANGAPRTVGLATVIQVVVVVDPTADSQRRRLPGRGR